MDYEEVLDSLLSEAVLTVPMTVKSHYFNLLYEVYLKKINGLDSDQRLTEPQ